MPLPHRDSQGLYRALKLNPDATEEQIQLSYEMLCEQAPGTLDKEHARVERAYTVLINPASRAAYDRRETAPPKKVRRRVSLNNPRLLAACVVLLLAILGLIWLPLYGSRLRSFSAGDALVDLNGRPFGTVVKSDDDHVFPGGVSAPAFLVDMSDTRELRWFPATDLQAACRRAE